MAPFNKLRKQRPSKNQQTPPTLAGPRYTPAAPDSPPTIDSPFMDSNKHDDAYTPLSLSFPSDDIESNVNNNLPSPQPNNHSPATSPDGPIAASEESSGTQFSSSRGGFNSRSSEDGSRYGSNAHTTTTAQDDISSSNRYYSNSPSLGSSTSPMIYNGNNNVDSSRRDSLFDPNEMSVMPSPALNDKEESHNGAYVSVHSSSPTLNDHQIPSTAPKDDPLPKKPQDSDPSPQEPQSAIILARKNRMAYIDGLRGVASVIIFTHHFADNTWSESHPGTLEWGTFRSWVRNGQMAVAMYFLLGGRVLAHGFQKSAFAPPKVQKDSHGLPIPGADLIYATGPKWLTLSSSLFRRSIRLAFPAIVVAFIQWKLCVDGHMDTTMEAAEVLQPTNLWRPGWCDVGNFAGFLRLILDLFTHRNRQYLLYVGSALWTTFDQFWGSVLVYITAAISAQLHWRGRYALYSIMIISLFYANMSNMLYIIGLFLSDLHASGFTRKLQDHWKPTIAVELAVMALALALVAGGNSVGSPADQFFGSITLYEGKFNWNPDTHWPQYMFFSNWVPAACVLIWVEVSHAMQWLFSWRIFCWVGKVSYGFYLLQFLTIFGVMPHLIIYFNNQGRSYWDMVVPTYIICLLINFVLAWAAYHLLDRIGLKLGKFFWDGFFVNKPKNASALPGKVLKGTVKLVYKTPGRMLKATSNFFSNKYHGTVKFFSTLKHWRAPNGVRPVHSAPDDPALMAQLHSTRWDSDISVDKEAWRTYKLLRFQQYTWIFHIFWIPTFAFLWVYFHPTGEWTFDALRFSSIWRFFWILSLPNCIAAYFGFITPDWAPTKKQMDKKPIKRECIRNFFVVLVTKGSNETAVRRGYNTLIKLEQYHPAIKTIVVTDEPYAYPDLQNVVCPKAYKSPLGLAKYKARALDYFRHHVSLGEYDWVLHMDEESVTDAETVRRCFEFIRYTEYHFGQGIILYNGIGFWDNWFFTVADGLRVGDDLARFHFQNSVVHRPIFGVHGSFLLTNGEVENECTWDFGSLAEDFEMSQDAWRRGFTVGRVHGIVREQSPGTVRDFMKQRRRWFMGIRDIKGMYGFPHLATNLWTIGVFTLAVTIINIPFIAVDSSLTPLWIAAAGAWCFATFMTLYIWGLLFQELDYGQKWWKIPIHLVCAIPIQPFASILEGLSAIWAMSSEDFGKFEVIHKR